MHALRPAAEGHGPQGGGSLEGSRWGMSRPVRQPGRRHGRQSLSFLCGSGIPKIKKRESEDSRVNAWTHLSACPLAGCGTRGDNPVLALGEGSRRGTGTLQQVQMIGPRRSTG